MTYFTDSPYERIHPLTTESGTGEKQPVKPAARSKNNDLEV